VIRIKGVIAAAITLALVIVFGIFLMNPLAKMAMISAGEAVFKAKTEIREVSIKPMESRLVIRGLAVADREREFKNLFEAEEITADLQLTKLLLKKVIIDELEIINLSVATDRKTSGFLPTSKLKKLEKKEGKSGGFLDDMMKKAGDKAGSEASKLPAVKLADTAMKIKDSDISSLVKKEDLESYKKILEIEKVINEKKGATQASVNSVNIEGNISRVKAAAESAKAVKVASLQDVPEAKKKLDELLKAKSELETAQKSVNEAKQSVEDFVSYAKAAPGEVNAAKERDIAALMKKFNIDLIDPSSIEKTLIGPVWYGRVKNAMEIAVAAKKYMPVGKKKNGKFFLERKKGAGRVIVFVTELPSLWIKKVKISVKGGIEAHRYVFKGTIQDVTSEQAATGKPTTFNVSLEKGRVVYGAEGSIRHIENINDAYRIYAKNLPPEISGLSKVDYGSVKMGVNAMDTAISVKMTDDTLVLSGTAGLKEIKFEPDDRNNLVYQALNGIDTVNVGFDVKNTKSGPEVSATSDALERIKKAIDKLLGSKVSEAKEKAKKEIDGLVKKEMQGLTSSIDKATESLKSQVKGYEDKLKSSTAVIDSAAAELNKKISGAAAPDALKGLFGK